MRPLAVTLGDPAGIGPELALRAWLARDEVGFPFFLLGGIDAMRRESARLGLDVVIRAASPEDAATIFPNALPVVPLHAEYRAEPGRADSANAAAVLESIERAVAFVKAGEASAIVTNPIAKHVLYEAGFQFPGHTEYLGAIAERGGQKARPVMMLWSPQIAVVPATVHISLAKAPRSLTADGLVATARIVDHEMRRLFAIAQPRIAVAGLNPHAGEGGAMGREEIDVIAPAIALLKAEGLDVSGPFPADTMFHAAARRRYDVALAMYHDQALIPFKTIAFDTGVNVTLGLPFIRTSPDHGVAFDIAGKGIASPASLIAALRLAARLAAA